MKEPGGDFGWSRRGEDKAWTSVLTSGVLQSCKVRLVISCHAFSILQDSKWEIFNSGNSWASCTWSSLLLPGMMIPTMLSAIPVSPASIAAARIFCILTCRHSQSCILVETSLTCWQSFGTLSAHFWWNLNPQVRQQKPDNKSFHSSAQSERWQVWSWSPWKRSRRQHSQKAREKKVFRTWKPSQSPPCLLFF